MTRPTEVGNGVPFLAGDGTPSVYPLPDWDAALVAIEFPAALEGIAALAVSEVSADALRRRRPVGDVAWIVRELRQVGEVLAAMRRGEGIDVPAVPPLHGVLARLRVAGSVLEVAELGLVAQTIAAGRLVARELARVAEWCPLVAGWRADPVPATIERSLAQAVGEDGELLDTASPGLAAARREVHEARERLIRKLEGLLRGLEGTTAGAGGSVTMREGRYVIPVRRDARQRPDGIVHDESASAGTLFIEPTAAIGLGNALRAAIAAEEREVLLVLRSLTDALRPHVAVLASSHAMVVAVDGIVARARWAHQLEAEVPDVDAGADRLVLRHARHPLLLMRGISVVPFELALDPDERTVLISGPNTGGKTVLLKATGLLIALAQSGIVPPVGRGTVLPVLRRFHADIGDHQNLAADLSTFSAHVAELRRILDAADDRTLVLLDEVGSGTDPAEGSALAAAVLETLTGQGAITLATTHLGALKSLATTVPGVVNASLEFDVATFTPTFRFQKGVPGRSYGLAIARRLGVAPEVLARAEALVPDAERQLDRLLAQVEARAQALARDEAAVAMGAVAVARREAEVSQLEATLQERELALRRAEKDAARQRARQAKAYLLAAREQVEAALATARGAADEAAAREARRAVEEAIRGVTRDLDLAVDSPAAGAETVAVGDAVRMATGATGEVRELRSDGRAVVLSGAVRLVVPATSLTRIAAPVRVRASAGVSGLDRPAPEAASEVDLRGLRVDEAEATVIAALDAAVLADLPLLRIIHGMGTGALRDVVRQLLAADPRVASFEFAPRAQGGIGVTIAVLR
jgi:DNA mismatch repair protein MutS2